MSAKGYFQFVKWYFIHRGNKCFSERGSRYALGRKDRIPCIVFAYILLIVGFPLALFVWPMYTSFGMACFVALTAIFVAIIIFCEAHFSFIYYFILYKMYLQRGDSINNQIIVEYTILFEYPQDVARMIQKYYYIRFMTSKINRVQYHLVERSKKRKKVSKKDYLILKITPDKIFFNKQEIYSKKITDLTVLEDFLREMQKQTG